MLGRHTGTLTLHTVDVGGTDLARHERVLRVVLEVAPAERRAVQVHARTEDDVAAVLLGLVADGLAHLRHQVGIPCRGQAGTDGKSRGVVRLAITLAGGVDTHAGRAVGQDRGRNAQAGNLRRRSGRTGHQRSFATYDGLVAEEVVGTADEQLGFLF